MLLLTVLVVLLQIYNYGRSSAAAGTNKICDDCIDYQHCEGALVAYRTPTPDTAELFKKGYCGFGIIDGRRIPQVCCSVFPTQPKNDTENSVVLARKLALMPEICGAIMERRILGGRYAILYEFPWMALISYRTRGGLTFNCAGSIINSLYILTAAHCVHQKNIAGVRVGEFDLSSQSDCQEEGHQTICDSHVQDLLVDEKIVHESYTFSGMNVAHDIALLRVRGQIDFNYRNVKPLCLPNTDELINVTLSGEVGTVASWGFTETGTESYLLRRDFIPILSDGECRYNYDREREFCAGARSQGSCGGDSGGPLVIGKEINGVYSYVQYGIVSRGPSQCGSNSLGIYTDVRKYMNWILHNIKP